MKLISTRLHAALDYLAAVCMYGAATIWRFDNASRTILIGVAVTLVVYALLTRFEYSIAKWIPMKVHLALDFIACLVLIVAAATQVSSMIGYRVTLASFAIGGLIVAGLTNPLPKMHDIPMSHGTFHPDQR
ncbi:MAG: hypothetical protein P4L33_10820 [Capsulimonadaceae bacterium]|nr:hypothetical protein [Capsulimonadaceae bacterium]